MNHCLPLIGSFVALTTAGCASRPQLVNVDHIVAKTGTIQLDTDLSLQTKDGFRLAAVRPGTLTISETQICGNLNLYRDGPDTPWPSWAPLPGGEFQRYQPISCVARDNIASTTTYLQQPDLAGSVACVALLPLCAIAHSVPGQ